MTSATDSVIHVHNVSFSYRPGVPVLEHVNLQVERGSAVCVVGPNGGGKSTLLKLLLGICQPTAGTIRIAGMTPMAARQRIGYVPQYFKLDEHFPIQVREVVLMGRLQSRWHWRYSAADREAAQRAIGQVDLTGLEQQSFASLSGGQRQRVLIARALASEPEILFLDEPVNNLDPAARSMFYSLLKRLHRRLTILMVSHERELVSDLFDAAICVDHHAHLHPVSELSRLDQEEMAQLQLKFIDHTVCQCHDDCDLNEKHLKTKER